MFGIEIIIATYQPPSQPVFGLVSQFALSLVTRPDKGCQADYLLKQLYFFCYLSE